jgi:hypothetical protein
MKWWWIVLVACAPPTHVETPLEHARLDRAAIDGAPHAAPATTCPPPTPHAPAFVPSGELRGTVYELDSGKPAVGATIAVAGACGEQAGISDDDGHYLVEHIAAGRHDVAIYYNDATATAKVDVGVDAVTTYNARIRVGPGESLEPTSPPNRVPTTMIAGDLDMAIARALLDARADPSLVPDWPIVGRQHPILLVDRRPGLRHASAPRGFTLADETRAADRERRAIWHATIVLASLSGTCARISLGVWATGPKRAAGGCRGELVYQKRGTRWFYVARGLRLCP